MIIGEYKTNKRQKMLIIINKANWKDYSTIEVWAWKTERKKNEVSTEKKYTMEKETKKRNEKKIQKHANKTKTTTKKKEQKTKVILDEEKLSFVKPISLKCFPLSPTFPMRNWKGYMENMK